MIQYNTLQAEKQILDTDHFSEWERDSAAGRRLRLRLESAKPESERTTKGEGANEN